ncbi:MAG: nucleotidyltransferase domain-containing protein [Anaerolineae bacterium]|nr:nucleotidyltransferase domain-containing protein [Anaerolineae bacterium]
MTKDERRRTKIKRARAPQVDYAGLARYFATQPDVVVAYLFGSVAKGSARPQSDVDIAVLFDARLNAEQRLQRERDIVGDLSCFATRTIDVRSLHCVSPVFVAQVLRYGQLLYARHPHERIEFEVRAMSTYLDTQPLREFFKRHLFQEIKEGNFGRRRSHRGAARTAPTIPSAVVTNSRR